MQRIPKPPGAKLWILALCASIFCWAIVSQGFAATAGGEDTAGTMTPEKAVHWAWQPLRAPAIPAAPAGTVLSSPIDPFIHAELARHGLSMAPEADRATLIRRLSFDLLGLPPSPEEIRAFVADPDPGAYSNLVERLLASSHYGERWARHWLDVVRYTESQGFEYDKLRDNAWHYRDYVIRSFNRDKPYDRFVKEQVAGDVIEPVTSDGIVASSLLVCGPWDEAGNAQANATQRAITREEEMEDLVSVVGQSFMGLTLNCARCHSHKFDPISQKEYFQVKSVFDGVKHGERMIASPEQVKQREHQIQDIQDRIADREAEVAKLEQLGWERALEKRKEQGRTTPAVPLPVPLKVWRFDEGNAVEQAGSLKGGARVDRGRLRLSGAEAYYETVALTREVYEKTLEAWVSLGTLQQGGGAAISIETEDGKVFDAIVYGERQPGKWMAGSSGFERTRDLDARVESTPPGGWVHMMVVYQTNGTIALFRNGEPYGAAYKPSSPLQRFSAGRARVLLGKRHSGGGKAFLQADIRQAALYDRALNATEVKAAFDASGYGVSPEEVLQNLTQAERQDRRQWQADIGKMREELKSVGPLPVSYVGTRVQPPPTRLLKRGDVKMAEGVVKPSGLGLVRGVNADLGLEAEAPEGQRRVRFAEWLMDAGNPLPARVMVNRVWYWHFGQGIVGTLNDFGMSGAKPTHPELLDWLAVYFRDHGWSVKALHRQIVNSATYRQSGRYDAAAAAKDADGQWLWRFTPRRLEAEAVRDAMLAVSGQLNPQLGGPSFRPFEVLKFPANAYVPVDREGAEYNRRSVYRMNVNSGKEPLLDAFDCPDPSVKTPRRGVTTTPLQALGLMNNSFVQRQASRLADLALSASNQEVRAAIETVYWRVLGRAPRPEEVTRAAEVSRDRGLSHVCWMLLNSTEFMYVR